jgi:hypothetical protein
MHLQYALLKCRNSASEMHKILKTACGDNAIGKHRFFYWLCQFKHTETLVEACEHSRYPYTGYFECKSIKNLFLQAKWITSITNGRFCYIWGATPPRMAGTVAESQLVHTPQQCTSILQQCRNVCPLNTQLWSPTLLNHLIWPLVTSSCFWEWNHRYDRTVSTMSLKFRNNCLTCYTWFQKVSSSGDATFVVQEFTCLFCVTYKESL